MQQGNGSCRTSVGRDAEVVRAIRLDSGSLRRVVEQVIGRLHVGNRNTRAEITHDIAPFAVSHVVRSVVSWVVSARSIMIRPALSVESA